MYPKISPSCSDIQVLHDEYMAALTKVQSAVKAIEAAYNQLSTVESAQSWLSDQGIPCPPVSELLTANSLSLSLSLSRERERTGGPC
jgi:hypothetical protein